MVIMRETAPKSSPTGKCAKMVSPWKNFKILVHVLLEQKINTLKQVYLKQT